MVACDSDLAMSHLEFNEIKGLLTCCGIGDLNFLKYLWCSYKICKDFEFREYMKHKKQDLTTIQAIPSLLMNSSDWQATCTLSILARTTMYGDQSHKKNQI